MTEFYQKLSAPFPPGQVHWRAQQISERNGKFSALALAYIDARDVMDRLDAVCGPEGWSDSYVETAKGRVLGSISISTPDQGWVSKSDGAGDTDLEGDKGGLSDAFKRTAVKWGIGRYLYRIEATWAECDVAMKDGKPFLNKQGNMIFRGWTAAGQKKLASALGGAGPAPKPDPVPQKRSGALPADVQDLLDDIACRDTQITLRTLWEAKGDDLSKGPHGAIVKDAFNKRKAAIELLDSVN